jgi:hypothetical protein
MGCRRLIDRHKPGANGKIVSTDYPDIFPVLKFGRTPNCGGAFMTSSTTGFVRRIATCS